MKKIYYGDDGCGKTVRLLRQAEALLDEGLTPVFVYTYHEYKDILTDIANRAAIHVDGAVFMSYSELMKNKTLFTDPNIRLMIDDLDAFLKCVLRAKYDVGIYATLSAKDSKFCKLDRSQWLK